MREALSAMSGIVHICEPNPLACGQAVIAMAAGADVADVIALVGTERETALSDMRSAFLHYGFSLSAERKEAKTVGELPVFALLSLETPRCWHWSLYACGRVYDPEHGVLDDFPESKRKYYWEIRKI